MTYRQHPIEAVIVGIVLGLAGWLIADMYIMTQRNHMLMELTKEIDNQSFITFVRTMNEIKELTKP